jgi:cytochrome c oxidase subunit 2
MTTTEHIQSAASFIQSPLGSATLGDIAHDFIFRRSGLGSAPMAEGVRSVDSIFMFIFWISTIVFVPIIAVTVWWSFKYRRVPGTIAQPSPSHNTILELAWSIVPLAFFAYMFFEGFHGYISRVSVPPDAMQINIVARKWSWGATYPNGAEPPITQHVGATDVPVFYVPEGKPVKFRMISTDVLHSLWIPDFRIKVDVIPNRYTSYWFNADKLDNHATGTLADGTRYRDHFIFCAEYCGDMHSEMAAIVRVVPEAAYQAAITKWVDAVDPVELGRRQWVSKCASCHTIDGNKNTGPTWKGIFGRAVAFTDGSGHSAEEMANADAFATYIRESVFTPAKHVVAGYTNAMPSFAGQLSEAQMNGIIEYMKTLK